jgi:succinoglycan biosynthesis transport protein ExoP
MLQNNMLHNQTTSALLDSSLQEQGGENSGAELVNLGLGFLRRQYLVIIIITALAFAASVIFLRIAPPTYTAQVKVLFENSKAPFVQQQSVPDEAPVDLESRIEILKSKAVATSVISQLNLADDPEFNGKGGWLDSVWKAIRGKLGSTPQGREIDPADELIAEFERRLSAWRVGSSTVIEVSFNSNNAQRAAEIANAIAGAYIDDQLKAKADAHRTATAWLHGRLRELGQDALTAERALNELKTKSNIVAADGKLMDEQQVTALNTRLVAARAQTSEAMVRLNRFKNILASNSNSASTGNLDAVSIGNIDAPETLSISDPFNNQIINNLRQQYMEYARREYEYSARYGSDHLAVVNLRTTMKSIRQSILDEVRRLAEISKSDFDVAKERQQEVEKQLAQAISQSRNTSSAELSIRELENSAKGYRSLYESFLQSYMGSLQKESFTISNARVISPAAPPQKKSKPNTIMILAFGMFGGIALGTALGFVREIMDRGIRTSAQIEARLHLPCLSLVPLLKHRKVNKTSALTTAADKESGQRTLSRSSGTHWAAMAMPSSRFAESIRSIRFAIDLDSTKTPNKVVGLISTLPNEGKSTVAASLALLLANSGKRVIIVDCDLRNPSLSADLAPNAAAGIIDVLSGARSLEDTVWTDPRTNLAFLPVAKRLSNTSEILCSEQTKKLFNKLRATYDYVIVDLPPLAPIVDVRATTPLIDCFILVVEWGRTTTDVVQHALHAAPNVYDAILGTVLNKTDMKAMNRYANYLGDYYNNEHYIRYGNLSAE